MKRNAVKTAKSLRAIKFILFLCYNHLPPMNLQLLITCLFLFIGTMVLARLVRDTTREKLNVVYTNAAVPPSFKGGDEALNHYLDETVKPFDPDEGEEGIMHFVVSEKGNIYEIKLVAGYLSFERPLAKALSKSSGRWNSALVNNLSVHAYCRLRVSYRDGKIWGEVE